MIYIGTSGYSYKDWTGNFYPKAMKSADQLKFYSQEFNFLEVNYTFYRVPEARSLEGMAKNVPDDFKFALKIHQTFTHDNGFNKDFRKALPALGDKLVLLLAQFPYSFKFTDESKDHILHLAEFFQDYKVTFEFRHKSWITGEALSFLKEAQLSIAAVDEPALPGLLPPVVLDTGQVGYVRFHGRNYQKWWNSQEGHERYTYEYTPDELSEWLPRLRFLEQSFKENYVAFNNHYAGGAVRATRLLKELLTRHQMPFR